MPSRPAERASPVLKNRSGNPQARAWFYDTVETSRMSRIRCAYYAWCEYHYRNNSERGLFGLIRRCNYLQKMRLIAQTLPMRLPRFAPPGKTNPCRNFAQPRKFAKPLPAIQP